MKDVSTVHISASSCVTDKRSKYLSTHTASASRSSSWMRQLVNLLREEEEEEREGGNEEEEERGEGRGDVGQHSTTTTHNNHARKPLSHPLLSLSLLELTLQYDRKEG